LVGIPIFVGPRHVVKLGNAVCGKRVTAVTSVPSAHDGGRGELGDGDVIRMAVASLRAERDNYMRPNSPDMLCNCRGRYRGNSRDPPRVRIAQDGDFTDAEDGCGCS
jgi:hypothetical protein